MSKKSDLFTDNPEMYFTGSFQEIATIIEKEWWEDKRKILTNLSRSIDFEMIENLPEDLRRNFLGREISPQEFDEENPPDDIFLFQVFKRDKGKSFEVVCSNKIRKLTKKLTKKEMAQIAEEKGIITVNAENENHSQARFASLDKNIIEPLEKQWRFIDVEKIGRNRWITITEEGRDAAEFLI